MLGRSMEEANPSAVMVFFSANKNNVQAHQDKPLEETARQEYQVLPYLISVACSPTVVFYHYMVGVHVVSFDDLGLLHVKLDNFV